MQYLNRMLHRILSFNIIDLSSHVQQVLEIKDSEPINQDFAAIGYEQADFIVNNGFLLLMVLSSILLVILAALI